MKRKFLLIENAKEVNGYVIVPHWKRYSYFDYDSHYCNKRIAESDLVSYYKEMAER